ncbi:Transmembrane nucleoporin [Malassezia furfur]|uniref:Transmembrane nucleoporin n=1 Tax=Malassezia furfur TaxID=55194 RepID=A0ABY8EVY9_MALFU|nr:POM33 [Malassezia furfur]WFD49339.1 Transmembrane nucleoporin [Malassezia furfur]
MLKASAPHLIWAAGHFITFLAGFRYLLTIATFSWAGYDAWYRVAYFGAIVSYGVVIYKSFGVPRTDKAYVQRALMDENVQYLVMAVYWCYVKPISITLIPYITFSLFHLLTFTRTTILPAMVSPSADSSAPPPHSQLSKSIQTWVKENYDRAMRFVSYAEVVIFVRVLFGALLFRNSLLAPLLYAHFLRLRFYMSSFTRAAFHHVRSELDGLVQHPSCPPVVRKGYFMLTDLVTRYASTVLSINKDQPTPATAARPTPQSSTPADPTKTKTR